MSSSFELLIACGGIFLTFGLLAGWIAWAMQRRGREEPAEGNIKVKRVVLDQNPKKKRTRLALKLLRAGYREEGWLVAVSSFKGIALVVGLLLAMVGFRRGHALPLVMFAAAGVPMIGWIMPEWFLSMRISERGREMNKYLIDMLDLLVICLEAGLSFNASLMRVVSELQWTSRVLSEEVQYTNHEIQMGRTRADALRNLGDRIGNDDFNGLLAVLIQAEKFGMSMAKTLRTQVESMRQKRRQKVQQAIHTIPVKMLFPMIGCIFPQLLMIILGPACIRIWTHFTTHR